MRQLRHNKQSIKHEKAQIHFKEISKATKEKNIIGMHHLITPVENND